MSFGREREPRQKSEISNLFQKSLKKNLEN